MNRDDIAQSIAAKLLDLEMLNLHNFSGDIDVLLECVQGIILEQLGNYVIISGSILP